MYLSARDQGSSGDVTGSGCVGWTARQATPWPSPAVPQGSPETVASPVPLTATHPTPVPTPDHPHMYVAPLDASPVPLTETQPTEAATVAEHP
jgi:hypothetical protein